jgi:hypothetical protein
MTSRVVFTGGRFHRYTLEGQRVPSVSTVINKAVAKPALVGWAARLTADWAATHHGELAVMGEAEWRDAARAAPNRARDQAMADGTLLHHLAESLVLGDPLPEADDDGRPWPDDIRRTAEQLARFYDAWNVQPVHAETIVFHEVHRWAGRLDLIADLADGHRWLIDYKTGATGVWPETSLQLSAYRHATHLVADDEDRPMTPTDRAGAVWLRPDAWELVPVRADLQTYGVFLSCLPVAAWAGMSRDQSVLGSLPPPQQEPPLAAADYHLGA